MDGFWEICSPPVSLATRNKYRREVSLELREKYNARNPSNRLLTPSYVTAELEITLTQIEPTKGDSYGTVPTSVGIHRVACQLV
jgi:hypothetical protein